MLDKLLYFAVGIAVDHFTGQSRFGVEDDLFCPLLGHCGDVSCFHCVEVLDDVVYGGDDLVVFIEQLDGVAAALAPSVIPIQTHY